MASKLLKVIIDTNLWISYLITKSHSQIDRLLTNKKIRIVFSEELLTEFFDVIQRPKLNKYFSSDDIKELLALFDLYGDLVKVKSSIEQCRDPKDNF
jgi:putative PIN family toxin of toxin-antitoxin system